MDKECYSSYYMREAIREEAGFRNYNYLSTPTIRGEERQILPQDLKNDVEEIIKSEEFKKFVKIDKSVVGIVAFISNKIRWERLEEVAKTSNIETLTSSFIAGLYAIEKYREESKNSKN